MFWKLWTLRRVISGIEIPGAEKHLDKGSEPLQISYSSRELSAERVSEFWKGDRQNGVSGICRAFVKRTPVPLYRLSFAGKR